MSCTEVLVAFTFFNSTSRAKEVFGLCPSELHGLPAVVEPHGKTFHPTYPLADIKALCIKRWVASGCRFELLR
jgi:hypothetical protein